MIRRTFLANSVAALACSIALPAQAMAAPDTNAVIVAWYRLVLELVRHTPTYSPPVASRALAYLGITAFEAAASGSSNLVSLAGQLNGFERVPERQGNAVHAEAAVMHAALSHACTSLFANTGPTGQRAMAAHAKKLDAAISVSLPADVAQRSAAHGQAVAAYVLAWSDGDGGAKIDNLGFPAEYALIDGASHWVPTNLQNLQQTPLLPGWGKNRAFAMPAGDSCGLPPPPAYSEKTDSAFYREAEEVVRVRRGLNAEQEAIARFWSDDAMASPTPPGHWISIALQCLSREGAGHERSAEVLALLGIALADAFIGCWQAKYEHDLLRPVTYIRRIIDPSFEPLLVTPPFPEYPSGHSTQSAAAAAMMTRLFGENFAFEDDTHARDGLPARRFGSFWQAAEEAGISRLYGGIHFRAAIERGMDQGRCIAAHAMALRSRR